MIKISEYSLCPLWAKSAVHDYLGGWGQCFDTASFVKGKASGPSKPRPVVLRVIILKQEEYLGGTE